MPLTLVLGPANSARAGEVLGAYALAARRDALLVVPTAADAAHYDRELAGAGSVLGRTLTFSGLLNEIARRAGYASPRLTAVQRERLLRRAIGRQSLAELAASADAAGFPAAAGRLFAELEDARVGTARFTSALRTWAGDDAGRTAYAEDLAALYRGYMGELERAGRVDGAGFAWGALDALRAAPARWGRTPVFLYGFDDLTGVERDAVETLSRHVGVPVTVSLTHEPGRAALAARARLAEELRAQAETVRELPSLEEHYDPASRDALHHVERWLFEPGATRLDPGHAVELLEAGGERAEAELVAAEVLSALRSGVPSEEVVVVCRSLARSGALLERALRRYGVNAWSERRMPIGHTSLGRALLALGRCALGSGEDLLAYLRAPGVADPAAVDALEAAVRRGGGPAGPAAWQEPLPELEALRRAPDPAAELAVQARRLLALAHDSQARVLSGEEQVDARAVAAVVETLTQLSELGDRLALGELLDLLEGVEVPAAAGDPEGAVLVSEPLAIRARRFRHVFVCGLCEGEFPAAGAGDPFLDEEQRRELALASGLALGAPDDPLARERYLFYACASRATERLVLSYRSSDEEGNRVLPSPFLGDVADLFVPEWPARRRRRLLADVVWPMADAPTARERSLSEAAAEGACVHPSAGEAATRFLGEAALAHVRHRELLSGGALERFADCPVKWLVESQLDPDDLEPEGEALTRGQFMHEVLERVVGGLGGPVTAASLPRAEELLDGIIAGPVPAAIAPGRAPAVRAAVLRAIEADLRRYLRHEADDGCIWLPAHVELQFGFEEGLAPLVLGPGEEVRVRGVIDRVDISADGREVIVRDYKSGATRPERAGGRWRGERQMQVALYMLAVRRLLGLEPVAGFYQPLTGRELRPRGAFVEGAEVGNCAFGTDAMSREELDELLAEIEAQAVELAATLRRGELTPCPETCSRDGCRHPGICWA